MGNNKFFRFWLPVIFWAGIIFFFSGLPFVKTEQFFLWDFIIKKSAHFFEYFILFTLLYRAIKNSSSFSQKRVFVLGMFILIVYAALDEVHQSFTPGREPRIRDVIIDSSGGLVSLWFIGFKLPKASLRLKNWAKNWQMI